MTLEEKRIARARVENEEYRKAHRNPKVEYLKDTSGEIWWCNSHRRKAEFICKHESYPDSHCCDPKLGGIMIPCFCVKLDGVAEITE